MSKWAKVCYFIALAYGMDVPGEVDTEWIK